MEFVNYSQNNSYGIVALGINACRVRMYHINAELSQI